MSETPWLSNKGYNNSLAMGINRERIWREELDEAGSKYTTWDEVRPGWYYAGEDEELPNQADYYAGVDELERIQYEQGHFGFGISEHNYIAREYEERLLNDPPVEISDYEVNKKYFHLGLAKALNAFDELFPVPSYVKTDQPYPDKYQEIGEVENIYGCTCAVLEAFKRLTFVYDFESLHGAVHDDGQMHEVLLDDLENAVKGLKFVQAGKFLESRNDISRRDIEETLRRIALLEKTCNLMAGFTYWGESAAPEAEDVIRKVIWLRWDPGYADFHWGRNYGMLCASDRYNFPEYSEEEIKERVLENYWDMAPIDQMPMLFRQMLANLKYLGKKVRKTKAGRIYRESRLMTQKQIEQYEEDFGAIDDYPQPDDTAEYFQIDREKFIRRLIKDGFEKEQIDALDNRGLIALALGIRGYDFRLFLERYQEIIESIRSMVNSQDGEHLGLEIGLDEALELVTGRYSDEMLRNIGRSHERYFRRKIDEDFRSATREFSFSQLVHFAYTLEPDLRLVYLHRIGCIMERIEGEDGENSLYEHPLRMDVLTYRFKFSRSTYYSRLRKVIKMLREHTPEEVITPEELELHELTRSTVEELGGYFI